jgi:MFS family permease
MRRAFFYGWVVVAVTAIVVLITAGVRSAPGAFLLTMTAEPGWSTASVSFAAAAGLIVFGFAGPLSGWLMGRIGVKNVVLLSLAVTGASLLATSLVREIWQLTVLFGLVSGLGTGLVASVLGPTVATRWFVKDRGLVVGIFGASNSAGQLVFFPLLTAMSVAAGWRIGAIVLGVISLALVLPVLIWLRNDPGDVGARPRGATEGLIAHVRPIAASWDGRSARPTSGSSPAHSSSAGRRRMAWSGSTSSPMPSTTALPQWPRPVRLPSWASSISSARSAAAI